MKTVVAGGTGFIGSHLVKALLEGGREVIVASDFAHLGNGNLSALGIKPSEIELRQVDLSDYRQALKAVEGADSVFHLAARVGSLEYLHGSEFAELIAVQTNLVIDANTFKACLEKKVKKIVYASSCAVYNMDRQYSHGAIFSEDDLLLSQGQVQKRNNEQDSVLNPDGGYGWAKLMGEIQLGWMKNIDIGIARIFNVYGENEPLGGKAHAIADLIRKAILYPREGFTVRGDGRQSRDFLYVSDCIDALLKLERKAFNPPVTVNIGSGKPTSIGTIAEKAVQISGKDIKIAYDTAWPVGPISRTADISRAEAILNWQPKVSLEDGLGHTYSWIQRTLADRGHGMLSKEATK